MLEANALGALDSFERGVVEHHLRWCADCRREAGALDQVASLLPLALTQTDEPAAATRAAIFDRIARDETEQRPIADPVPTALEPASPATSGPAWVRYASAALIAPLALALLVVGVWANSMRLDLAEQDAIGEGQDAISQALPSGAEVQLYSVEQTCPSCEGNGQLGVSTSNDMGMMVGWNFDPSQQHDVWQVNSDGEKKKVCQLQVDDTGAVMQMFNFPESPSVYTEVYITDQNGVLIYISHLGQANLPETSPPASA